MREYIVRGQYLTQALMQTFHCNLHQNSGAALVSGLIMLGAWNIFPPMTYATNALFTKTA